MPIEHFTKEDMYRETFFTCIRAFFPNAIVDHSLNSALVFCVWEGSCDIRAWVPLAYACFSPDGKVESYCLYCDYGPAEYTRPSVSVLCQKLKLMRGDGGSL